MFASQLLTSSYIAHKDPQWDVQKFINDRLYIPACIARHNGHYRMADVFRQLFGKQVTALMSRIKTLQ